MAWHPLHRFQSTRITGKRFRSVLADHVGILYAHAPQADIQPAIANGDNDVGRQRGWFLLTVEKGVARRQRRSSKSMPTP